MAELVMHFPAKEASERDIPYEVRDATLAKGMEVRVLSLSYGSMV